MSGYTPDSRMSRRGYPQYSPTPVQGSQYQNALGSNSQYYDMPGQHPRNTSGRSNSRPPHMPYSTNRPIWATASGFPSPSGYQSASNQERQPTQHSSSRRWTGIRRGTQPTRRDTASSARSTGNLNAAEARWTFDIVPAYDLDREALEDWLREQFGDANFAIEFISDTYRFKVPRKLTDEEKDEIAEKRQSKA